MCAALQPATQNQHVPHAHLTTIRRPSCFWHHQYVVAILDKATAITSTAAKATGDGTAGQHTQLIRLCIATQRHWPAL